jgi:hypothetical protein
LAEILAIVHVQVPLLQTLVPEVELARLVLLLELVEASAGRARTRTSGDAGLDIAVLQDLLLAEVLHGLQMPLVLVVDRVELLDGLLLGQGRRDRKRGQSKAEHGRQRHLDAS